MNFHEFKSLGKNDQFKIALDHFPIANRKDGSYTILLNKVDEFFVEIHFNPNNPSGSSINVIESFHSLELYWEAVSISELTELIS